MSDQAQSGNSLKEPSPFDHQIVQLYDAIGRLDNTVGQLLSRIDPILSTDNSETSESDLRDNDGPLVRASGNSKVVRSIVESRNRLEILEDQVSRFIDRVEL